MDIVYFPDYMIVDKLNYIRNLYLFIAFGEFFNCDNGIRGL